MTRTPSFPLLPALLLVATGVQGRTDFTITQPAESRLGQVSPRIVGGDPADPGQQRWITSLQYGGEHFCGGALLASEWVLTAAHCVITESASDNNFSVWIGGHDLRQESGGIRRDVTAILMHPQYNDNTLANDIALLRLASPVSLAPAQPATGEVMAAAASPGQPVTVSGWGALSEAGGFPDQLHEVEVPVVSNGTCNAPQSYGGEVGSTQLCAGLGQGGRDSCQGDSGGPLWVNWNGTDYHVGVVSWGEGCAQPDKYGVYTRTASFRSWIAQHLDLADEPDPGPDDGDGGDDSDDGGGHCPAPPADDSPHTVLTSGEVLRGLAGARDEMLFFAVDVPAGARRLIIDSWDGSGDADLYLAFEREPTLDAYDYSPYLEGNDERIAVSAPMTGRWIIGVHGYRAFQGLNLRAIIRD